MTKIGKLEVLRCPMEDCVFNDADTCVGALEVELELFPPGGRHLLCKSFKQREG